jgi:hypothetical protein
MVRGMWPRRSGSSTRWWPAPAIAHKFDSRGTTIPLARKGRNAGVKGTMKTGKPEFRLVDDSGLRRSAAIALLPQCMSNLRHINLAKQVFDFLRAHRCPNERKPKSTEEQCFL